jgi:outer membrane protein assembly factor BamA
VGLLRPLLGDHLRVADRFFIGGGTSMRGFAVRGLGVLDKDTRACLCCCCCF